MKAKYLVADTAAFVKNVPLWEYGEEVLCVPEVIAEIRDKQTKQRLKALPIPITMRQPQAHSMHFVNEFSKKTGDYASLSLTDMKLLALTYELEVEAREGSDHLRKEPQKIVTEGNISQPIQKSEDTEEEAPSITEQEESDVYCPGETEEESTEGVEGREGLESDATDEGVECIREGEEEEEDDNEAQQENQEEGNDNDNDKASDESGEGSGEEEEEEDDDDDGWITPSNIKKHKIKAGLLEDENEQEEEDILVACMTVDFAMQNTLKHIGLSVMGIDGILIRQIRTFILRCHACYHTTSVMTRIFCKHCGNKTLKRVSVTVNPDGSQKIWINYKKRINIRGTKFSLPTPKGGKHARNPLLVADQRVVMHKSTKKSRKKVDPLHEDYDPDTTPFAVRDVYSRAAQLGYIGGKYHNHYYWERRNPNEQLRKGGKKKK